MQVRFAASHVSGSRSTKELFTITGVGPSILSCLRILLGEYHHLTRLILIIICVSDEPKNICVSGACLPASLDETVILYVCMYSVGEGVPSHKIQSLHWRNIPPPFWCTGWAVCAT